MSDSATLWIITHQNSSVLRILQAGILQWVAMPSARDLPDPGTKAVVSSTLQASSLLSEPPEKRSGQI